MPNEPELPVDNLHFDILREARIQRRWFDDAQDRARTWTPAPCPKRS